MFGLEKGQLKNYASVFLLRKSGDNETVVRLILLIRINHWGKSFSKKSTLSEYVVRI